MNRTTHESILHHPCDPLPWTARLVETVSNDSEFRLLIICRYRRNREKARQDLRFWKRNPKRRTI